jgi:hypothetical protein
MADKALKALSTAFAVFTPSPTGLTAANMPIGVGLNAPRPISMGAFKPPKEPIDPEMLPPDW